MASITACLLPIGKALIAGESVPAQVGPGLCLGPNVLWHPINGPQNFLLNGSFHPDRARIPELTEMKGIGDWNVANVNAFLTEQDFGDVKLLEGGSDTFYIVGVLEALITWAIEGRQTTLQAQSADIYPAFLMGAKGVSFWEAQRHSEPVVQLHTQNGDSVFITVSNKPGSVFDLLRKADEIAKELTPSTDFGDAIVPAVDMDQKVNIRWLMGMWAKTLSKKRAVITQALQQTVLRMNYKGVYVKSAAAAAVTLEISMMPKPTYTVTAPFLLWITRPGLNTPILAAWIDYDEWKDPGSLTKKRG